MLGDLFKIFVEEPEKLTKVAIRIIKTILLLILAEWLYRQLFGTYKLMSLTEYREWTNFILSGRILVVISCFLIAKYGIEPLLALIVYLIVVRFISTRNFFKVDKNSLSGLWQFFDIIKIDTETKIPKPGKNIDILYAIATSFKDEEEVKAYDELKNSFLNNILNLYILFLLVYFTFLIPHFHSKFFIWVIMIGFVFIIFSYVIISSLIEFMQKEHGEFVDGIDMIKSNHLIMKLWRSIQSNHIKTNPESAKKTFLNLLVNPMPL